VAQFLGVKVGQVAIENEHLPTPALQMDQSFGSAAGLLEAPDRGTQTFEDAPAHDGTGAGHQDVLSIARSIVGWDRETRHTADLKWLRLERD